MSEVAEDQFRLVGTLVDGRFAVEGVVARGGFGLVYKATHVELAAPVALKVLLVPEHLRGAASSLVERFRQEARTLATLQHPAVVRALDVGSLDAAGEACVWMALAWLDGVTLDAHLRAREGVARSPREAFALLAPVLDAIACAHARGIAHRDLKPANLMAVPTRSGDVALCVLDFGIAKAMLPDEAPGTGQTETRSDYAAFSLPYAAPEQVGRLRTGPWTDVHALGLLFTEVLTGRAPYAGDDSFTLYASVMAPERPSPARYGVDVGPWEAVLARALALRPNDRFASAAALQASLAASVDEAQRAWERARAPLAAARVDDTLAPAVTAQRAQAVGSPVSLRRALLLLGALAFPAWGLARPPRAPASRAPRESPRLAAVPRVDASVATSTAAPPVAAAPRPPPSAPPATAARHRAPSRQRASPPRRAPARSADDPDQIVME